MELDTRALFDDGNSFLNHTMASITINTQISVKNKPQLRLDLVQDLKPMVQELFSDQDALQEIFGHPSVVKSVKVHAWSIEHGTRMHRLHMHLNVHVQHDVQNYSIGTWNAPLRRWLLQNAPWLTLPRYRKPDGNQMGGVYLGFFLSGARMINYTNKTRRRKRVQEIERELETLRSTDESVWQTVCSERKRLSNGK